MLVTIGTILSLGFLAWQQISGPQAPPPSTPTPQDTITKYLPYIVIGVLVIVVLFMALRRK